MTKFPFSLDKLLYAWPVQRNTGLSCTNQSDFFDLKSSGRTCMQCSSDYLKVIGKQKSLNFGSSAWYSALSIFWLLCCYLKKACSIPPRYQVRFVHCTKQACYYYAIQKHAPGIQLVDMLYDTILGSTSTSTETTMIYVVLVLGMYYVYM